jgi:hypothetical protein
MFWRKKSPSENSLQSAPPPWENIDTIPKRPSEIPKADLTEFVMHVTGFGKLFSRVILIVFALSLGFVAYIIYVSPAQTPPLPKDVNRPALDKYATSSKP